MWPTTTLLLTKEPFLVLRILTVENAPEYFAAVDANRAYLDQYDNGAARKYPTLATVVESFVKPEKPEKLRYGIRFNDAFIGTMNLAPIDRSSAEIGYWLTKTSSGHGFATTALRTLGYHAFGELDYQRLIGITHPQNTASQAVLERVGFKRVARRHGKSIRFELLKNGIKGEGAT